MVVLYLNMSITIDKYKIVSDLLRSIFDITIELDSLIDPKIDNNLYMDLIKLINTNVTDISRLFKNNAVNVNSKFKYQLPEIDSSKVESKKEQLPQEEKESPPQEEKESPPQEEKEQPLPQPVNFDVNKLTKILLSDHDKLLSDIIIKAKQNENNLNFTHCSFTNNHITDNSIKI